MASATSCGCRRRGLGRLGRRGRRVRVARRAARTRRCRRAVRARRGAGRARRGARRRRRASRRGPGGSRGRRHRAGRGRWSRSRPGWAGCPRRCDPGRVLLHDGQDLALELGQPSCSSLSGTSWMEAPKAEISFHSSARSAVLCGAQRAGQRHHELRRERLGDALDTAVVDGRGDVLRDDDVGVAEDEDDLEGHRHGLAPGAGRQCVGLVGVGHRVAVRPDQGEGHVVERRTRPWC